MNQTKVAFLFSKCEEEKVQIFVFSRQKIKAQLAETSLLIIMNKEVIGEKVPHKTLR